MVHALEEIYRMLRPGGCLIDIHPTHAATLFEVRHKGSKIFSAPVPEETFEYIRYANEALADVVGRGLFTIGQAREFDWRTYASSVRELLDYIIQESGFEEGTSVEVAALQEGELAEHIQEIMQAAGEGSQIARYSQARITRMHPVK